MPRPRHGQRGFTLTELMVVVAIIGVVAGLGFMMSNGEQRATTRSYSEGLVGDFDAARMRALATRRWQRVVLTERTATFEQGDSVGMAMPDSWTTISTSTTPAVVRIVALSTSTQLEPVTEDPSNGDGLDEVIAFAPDGSSVGRTIFLADAQGKSHHRLVVYSATGSTHVIDGW